jgi:2-polyprenyl-3-methyl-5-hydroxy-6-metoxy-1,4-benzoquinol methylase
MPNMLRWLDRTLYPHQQSHWDDAAFREQILRHITPRMRVMDLGAGAGIVKEMNFRGLAKSIAGVDPDPRVVQNPYLDEARIGIGESIPYPDASFDLVFADNVLEHLEQPTRVFTEIARTLTPGGLLLVKTPNRRHYMPTLARILPHRVHDWYNRLRGRETEDTFPTFYRVNTPAALRKHAAEAGLRVREVHLIEGRPEYLRLTWPTYLAGWAWERAVNTVPGLQSFRILLIGVLEKPASGEAAVRRAA